MQIDFHHTTTYVLARLAGFEKEKANIVAYSAQYVDDATAFGTICFDNNALYQRISSAHRTLDIRSALTFNNHKVLIPFHFLPGNGGKQVGENPGGSFINKLVCKENSPIARDMVRNAILDKNKHYGLHRFGVAMHVFADTWAHKGFAGVLNPINEVEDPIEINQSDSFLEKLKNLITDILDDAIPSLGHGRATLFPDLPFLKWKYNDGNGKRITRDNTELFCEACNEMFKSMMRYLSGDPDQPAENIPQEDMQRIRTLFSSLKDMDGKKRHQEWLESIKKGKFSFGAETVSYDAKGKNSWKYQALGTSHDRDEYKYQDEFLASNWKLFHDAIQAHLFYINRDLLPKYGICVA